MVKPVKVLGMTVYSQNGRLFWTRSEKMPGEHQVPCVSRLTIREGLSYLATLLPGMVPFAGYLRPLVVRLRSLCTKQAEGHRWDEVIKEDKKFAL
jgi:hypothetical protein